MQRENLFTKLINKPQTRRKLKFAIHKSREQISQDVENLLQMVALYIITHPINQKPMWGPTNLTKDQNPIQTISQEFGQG
jgi:hypothetical protein